MPEDGGQGQGAPGGAPPSPMGQFGNFGGMGLGAAIQRAQDPNAAYPEGWQGEATRRLDMWVQGGGLNRLMGENCLVKGIISCVVGGGGGLMLGAFLAPFDTVGGLKVAENATARETAVATMRQTATKAGTMGRTFAVIGAVYAGSECVIEKYRAKSDLYNSAYAGCLTGGILARGAGPIGVVGGCVGFAAWSTAIDSFMHSSAGENIMK